MSYYYAGDDGEPYEDEPDPFDEDEERDDGDWEDFTLDDADPGTPPSDPWFARGGAMFAKEFARGWPCGAEERS